MNRQQRRAAGPEPKTSNVSEIESLLVEAIAKVNRYLFEMGAPDGVANAMVTIENHCAVSLRVMRKTPASLLKSETMTFAIGQYMAGKEEVV